MNNNFKYNFVKEDHDKPNLLYIFLILYIAIGCYLSIQNIMITNYINLFDAAFNNLSFIALFLLPSFIIIGTKNYIYIESNSNLCLRFNSRNKYIKYQIFSNLLITFKWFLGCLLLMLIFVNFKGSFKEIITNGIAYKANNFIICLFDVIKIYFLIVFFQFTNILLIKTIKERKLVFIIEIILIFIIYNTYVINYLGFFKFLFPSIYVGFEYIFTSFYLDIIYSSIYFIVAIMILYFFLSRVVVKKDIEV